MGQLLLLLVVALTVAAVIFGVTVLVSGRDPGLVPTAPDSQAVALPGTRPLRESDVGAVRFDTGLRGYRMAQVDQAMRRAAYDIGYKSELIGVLEAEVTALREGRTDDAEALRQAREQSASKVTTVGTAEPDEHAASTDVVGSGAGPLPAATSSPADSDGVAPADGEPVDRDQTDGEPVDRDQTDGASAVREQTDAVREQTDGVREQTDGASADGAGQRDAVARSESA